MKKSKIVIGIAIALGITWLGGTWHTSKQVAEKYQETFNNVNNLIEKQLSEYPSQYPISIKVENVKADLGFFSSTFHYNLVLLTNQADLSIPIVSKVYNGPLPLNRLIKGRITPEGFSIETELQNTETTKNLFQATNNQSPLKIKSDVDFSGNSQNTFKIAQGSYADTNWLNSTGEIDLANDLSSINLSLDQLGIKFTSRSHNLGANFTVKNLQYALNRVKTEWEYLPLYQDQLHIDQISFSYFNYPKIQKIDLNLNNINSSSDQRLNGRYANGKINSTIDSISLNGQNLGKFTQNILAEHFDAKAVNQLVTLINQDQKQAQNFNLLAKRDEYWEQLKPILQEILANKGKTEIDPISLRNNDGEARFMLKLQLNAQATLNPPINIANLFSNFVLEIKVDKPALNTWIKDLAIALPQSALPTDENGIEQVLKQVTAYPIQMNFLTENKDAFKSVLTVKDGHFYLNGQPLPIGNF